MNCTFCRIFIQRQDANHSRRGGWQSLWVPSTVVSIVPWISGIIHFIKDLAWGFLISVEQSLLSIWRILCWKVGSKYCKEDPWRKSEWMLQHLVRLKILSITSAPELYFSINLTGVGIGDGWMSPYHEARWGVLNILKLRRHFIWGNTILGMPTTSTVQVSWMPTRGMSASSWRASFRVL